jgi:hypothetical protein
MSKEGPPRSKAKSTEAPPLVIEAEKQSAHSIVMENKVLMRQTAGRSPKPKRASRKSLADGGNVYKPFSLESTFDDKTPADTEPRAAAPESAPEKAESVVEYKQQMRQAVEAIVLQNQIHKRREYIKSLEEEEKNPSIKRMGVFAPKRNIEERILAAEDRLRALERRSVGESPLHAANDNEKIEEKPNVFREKVEPKLAEKLDSNIMHLSAANRRIYDRIASPSGLLSKRGKREVETKIRAAVMGAFALLLGGSYTSSSKAEHTSDVPRQERVVPVTAAIKHGEGADQMFADLQKQLHKTYEHASAKDIPPVVQNVLSIKNPHNLSLAYGFISKDGHHSRIMHGGDSTHGTDSISVNEHGQLVFHAAGKADHVLLEGTTHGNLSPHPLSTEFRHASHGNYDVHTTHTSAHYTPKAGDPSDALNAKQAKLAEEANAEAHARQQPAAHSEAAPVQPAPEALHLDLKTPTVYDSGDGEHHLIMWGGTHTGDELFNEQLRALNDTYYNDPKNVEKNVLVERTTSSGIEIFEISVDGNGMGQAAGPFDPKERYPQLNLDPAKFKPAP